jgi:hypothetical protein
MTARPATRFAGITEFALKTITKEKTMKSTIRYQYQMPRFRSYRPPRAIRIRLAKRLNLVFRPVNRFGAKPKLEITP